MLVRKKRESNKVLLENREDHPPPTGGKKERPVPGCREKKGRKKKAEGRSGKGGFWKGTSEA